MLNAMIATIFRTKKAKESDIRRWAEIEYKKDADFAYNYMVSYGSMPDLKLTR